MTNITGITQINNDSPLQLNLQDLQNADNNFTVAPNKSKMGTNIWIDWCDSQSQWKNQHLIVTMYQKSVDMPSATFYIWQYNSKIYCWDQDQWSANAPAVAGDSEIGVSKIMSVTSDLNLSMSNQS